MSQGPHSIPPWELTQRVQCGVTSHCCSKRQFQLASTEEKRPDSTHLPHLGLPDPSSQCPSPIQAPHWEEGRAVDLREMELMVDQGARMFM